MSELLRKQLESIIETAEAALAALGPCEHMNREPLPVSTMGNLTYICTDCGAVVEEDDDGQLHIKE